MYFTHVNNEKQKVMSEKLMEDCLFCKIISGKIPCERVYEDENCLAFRDIAPKAPTHFLLVPKTHVENVHSIGDENGEIAKNLFAAVAKIVKQYKLDESGYRMVVNSGKNGRQTVFHLHIHILGGKKMGWSPA